MTRRLEILNILARCALCGLSPLPSQRRNRNRPDDRGGAAFVPTGSNGDSLGESKRRRLAPQQVVKIGRPAYKCVKNAAERTLAFSVLYPQIEVGTQPLFRFMSTFEQRVERPDRRYQFLVFHARPYESIAFKIPNLPVDRLSVDSSWDAEGKQFSLSFTLNHGAAQEEQA